MRFAASCLLILNDLNVIPPVPLISVRTAGVRVSVEDAKVSYGLETGSGQESKRMKEVKGIGVRGLRERLSKREARRIQWR